ncbi:MAG: hypothetical protein COC19_05940 [SAR86 cluster bacterium]|uniref:histidine kinase n=1 Tax=SAR86 cluster bacterium TaxID=2030880 RepID=A0A2A4MLH6_9GAMM|nr:MAG: hypothetical protein COC19_05940 [SAR86 cluster bacterium]
MKQAAEYTDTILNESTNSDWSILRPLIIGISLSIGLLVGSIYIVNQYYQQQDKNISRALTIRDVVDVIAVPLALYDYSEVETAAKVFENRNFIIAFELQDFYGVTISSKNLDVINEDNANYFPIYLPNTEHVEANKIGLATFYFKKQEVSSLIFGAFLRLVLTAILVSIPCAFVTWSYLKNYIYQPLQHLRSSIEDTLSNELQNTDNTNGRSTFGAISQKFDEMHKDMNKLNAENISAKQSRNQAVQALVKTNIKLQVEFKQRKSYSEMLHSVFSITNQSIVFVDSKENIITLNMDVSANTHIRSLMQSPLFTFKEFQEEFRQDIAHIEVLKIENDISLTGDTENNHSLSIQVEFNDGSSWLIRTLEINAEIKALMASDVSEMQNIHKELLEARKMEAVGVLTGGVAHDFNNILSIILTSTGLLNLSNNLDATQAEAVHIILSACDRAEAVINQLLTFSRTKPENFQTVNLVNVFTEFEATLPQILGQKIKLNIDIQTHKSLYLDAGLFYSAIINLTNNASNAMQRAGKFDIKVSDYSIPSSQSKQLGLSQEYVLITFSDSGSGIAPETLKSIFEPFFTTNNSNNCTGLGLAMVHNFVTQSGGRIWCESSLGQGSCFYMTLPVSNRIELEKSEDNIKSDALIDKNIVIVDDEIFLAQALLKHFDSYCKSAQYFDNAIDAKEFLERHDDETDILITDLHLAGDNGLDLAKIFKRRSPDSVSILMSGHFNINFETEIDKNCIDKFIAKPFSLTAIHNTVLELIA